MTIGTNLQHALATKHFTRLDDDISSLQAQIASGEADPRSSVDPVRALNMSATEDQKNQIMQFSANLTSADERLTMTDAALSGVSDVMQRFAELSIRNASGSVSETERASLLIEAESLRDNLISLAKSRDATGRALFGGYQTEGQPFEEIDGRVTYVGDSGVHSLRVSENAMMPTGLNGLDAFMNIPITTENGTETQDLFTMVDDLIHAMTSNAGARQSSITAPDDIRLTPGSSTGQVSMTIEGPAGQAQITAPYLAESPDALIAAINAETATTGVTAVVDPSNPNAIRLSGAGNMTLSGLEVEGGSDRNRHGMTVTPMVGGQPQDTTVWVAEDQTVNSMVGSVNDALEHIADARAKVGAQQQVGDRYATGLSKRTEMVEKALAGYKGLDIAAAVTELQAMMLNRSAAQQTYARISNQTLFDFLG